MESKSSRERNCPEMEAILVDGLFSFLESEINAVWCFPVTGVYRGFLGPVVKTK